MALSRAVPRLSKIWQTRWTPFLGFTLELGSYGLLVWALVVYGENNASHSDCGARDSGSGFQGNSDMYGLGIRLGVYLQWIGSAIGSIWLATEWQALQTSYLLFNTALTVAMFLLTFRFDCTYTAEVILFLFLRWGGNFVVNISGGPKDLLNSGDMVTAIRKTGNWYQPRSLTLIQAYMSGVVCVFSAWFWIRLLTKGEVDFVPTPSGTYYFLFARLRVSDSKPALRFMVFLCFLYCCLWLYYTFRGYKVSRRLRKGRKTHDEPEEVGDKIVVTSNMITSYVITVTSFIYTVLAVELTLVWNSVTGVYDVASTGQVIPLILGAGMLISTCWKLKPKELSINGAPRTFNATFWTNFELDEDSNITLVIKESEMSPQNEAQQEDEEKI